MKTIKQLREAKGWTQVELANKLSVAPSTIYNWERGRFEPRLKQLRDLARALGVSMNDIASEEAPSAEPRKQPAA